MENISWKLLNLERFVLIIAIFIGLVVMITPVSASTCNLDCFVSSPSSIPNQFYQPYNADPFTNTPFADAFNADPFTNTPFADAFNADPFTDTPIVNDMYADPFTNTPFVNDMNANPFENLGGNNQFSQLSCSSSILDFLINGEG
ncbi:MAG: hypothetical protein WCK53_12865 [Methanomicrobiales archaeon]